MATGNQSTTELSINIPEEYQHSSKFCPEHKNEAFQMYCTRCDCLICLDCILGKHRNHEYDKIGNITKRNKRQIEDVFEQVKSCKIPKLENSIVSITKMQENYSLKIDKLMEDITTKGEKLKHEIDKIMGKIRDELMKQAKKDKKYLQETKEQIDNELTILKRQLNDQEEKVRKFNDIDIIVQAASVRDSLEQLTRNDSRISSVQTPKFQTGQLNKKDLMKMFGQLLFEKKQDVGNCPSLRTKEQPKLNHSHQVQVASPGGRMAKVGLKQKHSQLIPQGTKTKIMGSKGNRGQVVVLSGKAKTAIHKNNNMHPPHGLRINKETEMGPKVNQGQMVSFHEKEEIVGPKPKQDLVNPSWDKETMVGPTQSQENVNPHGSKETTVVPKINQGCVDDPGLIDTKVDSKQYQRCLNQPGNKGTTVGFQLNKVHAGTASVNETTEGPTQNQRIVDPPSDKDIIMDSNKYLTQNINHADPSGVKETTEGPTQNQRTVDLPVNKDITLVPNDNLNKGDMDFTGVKETTEGSRQKQGYMDLPGNKVVTVGPELNLRNRVHLVGLETTLVCKQNLSNMDHLDGLKTTVGQKQNQSHVSGTVGYTLSNSLGDYLDGKETTVGSKINQNPIYRIEENDAKQKTKTIGAPVDSLGGKEPTVVTKDHASEKDANKKTKPNLELKNFSTEKSNTKDAKVVSSLECQKCLTKIEMSNDKQAWILKSLQCLDLVSYHGKHINSLRVNFKIFDMAILSGDLLVTISGGHHIKRVSRSGQIEDFADLSSSTCGIHVTNNVDILVGLIGVMRRGRVTRLSPGGRVLDRNICQDVDLYGPNRITENVNYDIVIINEWECIVVVDKNGKFRFKYLGETMMDTKPFRPTDVICNQVGDILIADENMHKLHVLNKVGDFMYLISTKNAELQWPVALDIDEACNIWVGCKNGQVFILK